MHDWFGLSRVSKALEYSPGDPDHAAVLELHRLPLGIPVGVLQTRLGKDGLSVILLGSAVTKNIPGGG